MRRVRFFLCLLAPLLLGADSGLKPTGFINDFAGVLSPEQVRVLEEDARRIERETGAEVAVVIVKDLGGQNLESSAHDIFNSWGIGKKDKDNGVLILISMAERKIRIETGYGVEHLLPDGLCGNIIRNVMAPEFRAGKIAEGIQGALSSIEKAVAGEGQDTGGTPENQQDIPPAAFVVAWEAMVFAFTMGGFGLSGVIVQIVLLAAFFVWNYMTTGHLLNPMSLLGAMVLPFFTIFVLMIVYQILGSLGVISKKKPSLWFGLPATGSSSHGWGGGFSGGGGFGGGSSGGGGASGGW